MKPNNDYQYSEPKIDPCPFCGGKAMIKEISQSVYIECQNCGAKSPMVQNSPYYKSAFIAAERWNRRWRTEDQIMAEAKAMRAMK